MAVWLKVALLLIYLAVLFILARVLEAVTWYEQGQISRRLLDPMALSVLKLKALLEQRGVSYDNMVEKTELTELVNATGTVTDEELETATTFSEEEVQITNYTSDIDFYEQVEDAKDSMWLVEILTDNGGILSDSSWHLIRKKVGKFGVRLGRFDCQQHVRLCIRKNWLTSRLVLALPENYRTKANVALSTYTGPVRINSLFDWIKSKVNEQITTINDVQDLEENWLSFDSALSPDVKVVFVSTLTSIPLFLSALSVRFPGRVKIGSVKMDSTNGKKIAKYLDVKSSPTYIVITRDSKYIYETRRHDIKNFRSMEMFLKTLYPSINDIFITSFLCVNITSFFELSVSVGGVMKRAIKFFLCMLKYNLILFLVWISVLAFLQVPLFTNVTLAALKLLRYLTLTELFSCIRNDILYYSSHKLVPLTVLLIESLLVLLIKLKYPRQLEEIEDEENDWWNFSNLRTLNYYNGWEMMRLRPFDQIFNPTFGGPGVSEDYGLRQTVNSIDYIKFLPVWLHGDLDCRHCAKDGFGEAAQMDYQGNIKPDADVTMTNENTKKVCTCQKCLKNPAKSDNQKTVPSVSKVDVGTAGVGSSSDNPWNGLPTVYSKVKKIENLNACHCKPPGFLDSTNCVICLESYSPSSLVRGLPCKHVFHDQCILVWLLRDNHFCPVCRWPSFQSKEQDYDNELHSE